MWECGAGDGAASPPAPALNTQSCSTLAASPTPVSTPGLTMSVKLDRSEELPREVLLTSPTLLTPVW